MNKKSYYKMIKAAEITVKGYQKIFTEAGMVIKFKIFVNNKIRDLKYNSAIPMYKNSPIYIFQRLIFTYVSNMCKNKDGELLK